MSGGHYDYKFGHMNDLAVMIRSDCDTRETMTQDGHGYLVEPIAHDIIQHMRYIAEEIEKLSMAVHDIEWLLSGDYGEDTLRERCESWKLSGHLRSA